LKQRALSEYRCTELPVTPFCARWQAENLSCARLQAMKKKLDFLQLKASFFTNVSKAIL